VRALIIRLLATFARMLLVFVSLPLASAQSNQPLPIKLAHTLRRLPRGDHDLAQTLALPEHSKHPSRSITRSRRTAHTYWRPSLPRRSSTNESLDLGRVEPPHTVFILLWSQVRTLKPPHRRRADV
jgi:hypothetical protein